jgi:hypothetical protein
MIVKKVNSKEALEIIEKKEPRGLFYYKLKSCCYIGIDNSAGYAWTKRFRKLKLCKKWLRGLS